ncbi:MAG: YlmC/YmxH family sporulation protein [Clostridia bacterium]|jgi:YlmC/YmxH family sporulation protein|nr:YlmC/YmxH family sporulation protein [Clostridia bacterium]MBQ4365619.1 YlmC/YmxH family sporulation protein [Clostridia bacterium]MBQ6093243.1 YlmC/YmxH family sporulation protein [Clostridia bacterium]
MQCCSVTQLRDKEVISTKSGGRIGFVNDVEINTREGRLCAILVYGRRPRGGLFGKEQEIRIPWEDVEVIGEDTILVRCQPPAAPPPAPKGGGLFSF